MASVVLGVGSSHGPTMRTPPEQWVPLGKKDAEDPRFDYAAALKRAPAGLDKELTLEKTTEKYNSCQESIQSLRKILAEAKPDAIVVISNLHGDTPDYAQQTFGLYLGDEIPRSQGRGEGFTPAWMGRPGGAQPQAYSETNGKTEAYPADAALSQQLYSSLQDSGFDISVCHQFKPNSALGDAFTGLYSLYWPSEDLPMVPFMISRDLPNEPNARRVYDIGRAIRDAIDSWDSDKRVVVMASGGLSHQIVDEELDRTVIEALEKQDEGTLRSLSRDRLNGAPGTPETLNWVCVSAIMQEVVFKLVGYQPCYRSMAGTGHGVTYGYWQP